MSQLREQLEASLDLGRRTREHVYETTIAELLAGLKPFAEVANAFIEETDNDYELLADPKITVGQYRHARSLIEKYGAAK